MAKPVLPYWPRALRAPLAAAYMGMSEQTFRLHIAPKIRPVHPIPTLTAWLREDLDAYLDALTIEAVVPEGQPSSSVPTEGKLKHVVADRDRHGNVRHYLRLPGKAKVRLPGEPGSPEFLAAYSSALAAAEPPQAANSAAAGTLNALAVAYYASPAFRRLRATSQANYRRIIERLRTAHGTKPVAKLQQANIRALLREREAHPAAQNHLLRCLRALMALALERGEIAADPTKDIKRATVQTKGYRPWTEDEIAQYEDAHPSGTKARLAFALLLHTGQRRSDVVRMGRQHLSGGLLTVRQVKTGATVTLPIGPELLAELAHVPAGQMTFLARPNGKPHTAGGFYNLFTAWCAQAGLEPGLAPHGLRKAAARRLAEAGATVHQIAAVTGHKTLSEVQVYTDSADRARLAKQGMALVEAMFHPAL